MDIKPERIASRTLLAGLAALTATGAVVAVVGLALTGPGDDGAMRAYVAGLIVAVLVGALLATLFDGRRRALVRARVTAADLERRLERVREGRADAEEAALAARAYELVEVFVRAGAYGDAERLAVTVAHAYEEPPAPIRLGAAAAS